MERLGREENGRRTFCMRRYAYTWCKVEYDGCTVNVGNMVIHDTKKGSGDTVERCASVENHYGIQSGASSDTSVLLDYITRAVSDIR